MRHVTCLLLSAPILLSAAVVEDFSAHPAVNVIEGSRRGTSAAVEIIPGSDNAACVLRIADQHEKLHEVYFLSAPTHVGKAVVTVRYRQSGAFALWSIPLRVKDAEGETFQFPSITKPDPAAAGGEWATLRYEVGPGLDKGHWGNPGDGVFTGAWRVVGFAVQGSDALGAGEFWFDDVAYEEP